MTQICGVPLRSDVKAISCPVGLQQGAVLEEVPWVSRRASVPSAWATQISMCPVLLLAKAIFLPSGLHDGAKTWPNFPPVMSELFPS